MCTNFFDLDAILSENEQWTQLEEQWGIPVDLDTEEEPPSVKPAFSTLDLMQTTFDSSFLVKKVRRKVGRRLSKYGVLDYNEFLQDLQVSRPQKQVDFVNGQKLSATSVEELCNKIDDIFMSLERLSSASTTTHEERFQDENGKISVGEFSSDDLKQKTGGNVEKYFDDALEKIGHLSQISIDDDATKDSVTTLVRKFSSILSSPTVNCSPRRRTQCDNKFKELTEYWQTQAFKE